MIIYHGEASNPQLETFREVAPSHDHGMMMSTYVTERTDTPYAIDNGAFRCWQKDVSWYESGRADQFVGLVQRAKERERQPDFIVLPDVVMDAHQTRTRTQHWAYILRGDIGVDTDLAFPCQNGMDPAEVVKWADFIHADLIFVGGDLTYKRRVVPDLLEYDYPVHVGRPGDLLWAKELGVRSVDTTSMGQNQDPSRLERLEHQSTLPAGKADS